MRIRPSRTFLGRASNREVAPDNWLAPLDHALFIQHRAIGRQLVIQVTWVYRHPIDIDGLRRFRENLSHGLLGRRIELSPVPFARHRWVADRGPSDIDIAEHARPPAEVSDWSDERSQLPIDPETGPGWHLGVLPLTDGSTAVSLVFSHYLIDGIGLVLTLIDGTVGNTRDLGYPPPRSRTRLRAAAQDVRQVARNTPEVFRALGTAARLARQQRQDATPAPAPVPVAPRGGDGDGDDPVMVPGITFVVDLDDWDRRAKALGGTSNTLVAGFVAKLGERAGRRRASDGAVTLQLPMSVRTEGDTRANAMSFARVSIDPERVTTDLRDVRAAIKEALTTLRDTPDPSFQLTWLASFTPKRALKRMAEAAMEDPDLPVFCSNLGDVGAAVSRPDGTPSEYVTGRVTAQRESRQWLERLGGQLIVQSWRLPDTVVTSVNAYFPGAENTKPALRQLVERTLAEFDLTGEID